MNKSIDALAKQAGFLKAGEISTCTDPTKITEFGGMEVISTPLMPEGFCALTTKDGAMVMGPKGVFWVSFNYHGHNQ